MKEQKGQLILAVSGVKNSGKTTLIASLLSKLKQKGLKVAVIKHDGHEFEADIPGTDTWSLRDACFFRDEIYDGQISAGTRAGRTDRLLS